MAQPAQILSASLQQQLNTIAKSEGFNDFKIVVEKGSENCDGFVATMLAVNLDGTRQQSDGTQRPDRLSLICKLQSSDQAINQQLQSGIPFERETIVYTQILPAIRQFQVDRGLQPTEIFHSYPKCYLAQLETETDNAIIIMQNMRTAGFSMWGKKKPLSYANAKLLVEQLGQLHGVSVAIRDQRPELYAEWTQMPDMVHRILKSKTMQSMFTSGYDRAISLLDNQHHIGILKAFKTDFKLINSKCMDRDALGAFSVLAHGDCWNNNMMYGPNNESITILDWQLTRVTSPAVDLSMFLFSSTDKALREQHLDDLLSLYYAQFAATIRKCGSDPEKLYTFANLQDQLSRFGVWGVLLAPLSISVMVADTEDLVHLDEIVTNAESPDAHLATLNTSSEKAYVQRLTDVFDDAVRYGWLSEYDVEK